jgi:hypothetical protein
MNRAPERLHDLLDTTQQQCVVVTDPIGKWLLLDHCISNYSCVQGIALDTPNFC